jgi:hypothetical protein
MGDIGQPEDIGWASVHLSSAAAKYVTGQTSVVDGGAVAGFWSMERGAATHCRADSQNSRILLCNLSFPHLLSDRRRARWPGDEMLPTGCVPDQAEAVFRRNKDQHRVSAG